MQKREDQDPFDGPLILTLLLTNQNQNRVGQDPAPAGTLTTSVSSSLVATEISPKSTPAQDELGLTLRGSDDTQAARELSLASPLSEVQLRPTNNTLQVQEPQSSFDGPILLTLLLTNQNQNQLGQPTGQVNPAAAGTLGAPGQSSLVSTEIRQTASLAQDGLMLRLRGSSVIPEAITETQIQAFHQEGFVVIPDAVPPHIVDVFREEARRLVKIASTGGPEAKDIEIHFPHQPFPSPVGRILATFEPLSLNDSISPSGLYVAPPRIVTRLGCGIHQGHDLFRGLTFSDFNKRTAKALGLTDPCITQSLIHPKLRSRGSASVVNPHQDGWVSFTDPITCVTFWYALEDATIGNGCLEVAPGSHRTVGVQMRALKGSDGRPKVEHLDTAVLPKGFHAAEKTEVDAAGPVFVPLEVKAGTLILMHGGLLHRSASNATTSSRFAYSFSVIDKACYTPHGGFLDPENGGEFERLI